MPDENVELSFPFVFNEQCDAKFQEHYTVSVWCDGRLYDPSIEAYRPVYTYKIVGPDWEYIDNDIYGTANEVPDLVSAAKSLFAFLIAAQEGLPEDVEGKRENAEMFPQNVREFAYLMKEELMTQYTVLEKQMMEKK